MTRARARRAARGACCDIATAARGDNLRERKTHHPDGAPASARAFLLLLRLLRRRACCVLVGPTRQELAIEAIEAIEAVEATRLPARNPRTQLPYGAPELDFF